MSLHGPCLPSSAYCSIGAYCGVSTPVSVRVRSPIAWRAAPKSIRTGTPSRRMMMFDGLMSRCRKPWACTAPRPPSRPSARRRTSSAGRRPAGLAQELADALAVLELHDGVGRAVGLEVAQHRHDVRMAEARERARLVEEALAAPGEVARRSARRAAPPGRRPARTANSTGRYSLMATNLASWRVEGAVGDAEAAMADHRVEPVVAEPGAGRQGLDVVEGHGHAQPGP